MYQDFLLIAIPPFHFSFIVIHTPPSLVNSLITVIQLCPTPPLLPHWTWFGQGSPHSCAHLSGTTGWDCGLPFRLGPSHGFHLLDCPSPACHTHWTGHIPTHGRCHLRCWFMVRHAIHTFCWFLPGLCRRRCRFPPAPRPFCLTAGFIPAPRAAATPFVCAVGLFRGLPPPFCLCGLERAANPPQNRLHAGNYTTRPPYLPPVRSALLDERLTPTTPARTALLPTWTTLYICHTPHTP